MPQDNKTLNDRTDEFLVEILAKVRHIGDGVDVRTQIDFFKEMVKWAAVKAKIAPEGEEGSKIDEYRNALKASSDGRGGDRTPQKAEKKPSQTTKPRNKPESLGALTGPKFTISATHSAFPVPSGGGGFGGLVGSGADADETGSGGHL